MHTLQKSPEVWPISEVCTSVPFTDACLVSRSAQAREIAVDEETLFCSLERLKQVHGPRGH